MATKTQEVATQESKPVTQFDKQFEEYTPQIKAALPDHVPVDRFKRVVLTAMNQNPDLGIADRRSLFTSCVSAAQDGLLPDGKEAALVIFNTKNKRTNQWEKKVQYMPMIAGVRKRMRNSGEVLSAVAHVVYENDDFAYELGDEETLTHRPVLTDRGEPIAAYAVIKLANGEVLREVMSVDEIEQARAVSKAAQNGPWVSWWGEMARKTVMRRCAKSAPTSTDLDRLLTRDDALESDDPGPRIIAHQPAPPRPTREQFDPAAAGHTDPDAEYRQTMGEVVTDDGEVIEPEPEPEPDTETPEPADGLPAEDIDLQESGTPGDVAPGPTDEAGAELQELPTLGVKPDKKMMQMWGGVLLANAPLMTVQQIADVREKFPKALEHLEKVDGNLYAAVDTAFEDRLASGEAG